MEAACWYVYILENAAGKRYVGITGRDPEVRLAEHNTGLNRWTRSNGPWHLVYSETQDSKREALSRERFLKTGIGRRVRDTLVESRKPADGEAEARVNTFLA